VQVVRRQAPVKAHCRCSHIQRGGLDMPITSPPADSGGTIQRREGNKTMRSELTGSRGRGVRYKSHAHRQSILDQFCRDRVGENGRRGGDHSRHDGSRPWPCRSPSRRHAEPRRERTEKPIRAEEARTRK
jgi:hypothetical protein